ncbi:MAG: 30S ribosomal protein S9 [Bdellovibrionota bacterium]
MATAKAIYATGRRKTASARVFLFPTKGETDEEKGKITVNGKALTEYFPQELTQMILRQPLEVTERLGRYDFEITVRGGGKMGQAGAVLHGIARALRTTEEELREPLRRGGFLTRDPRAVERKKPGRHKARKRPQFSKR